MSFLQQNTLSRIRNAIIRREKEKFRPQFLEQTTHVVNSVSCMGYASQAAVANEYRGLVFMCTDDEIANGTCQDLNGLTGEKILYNRGMDDVDVMFNIIMLWVLAILYRIIAFICFWLFFRNHPPKQIIRNMCSSK
eukprot:249470_1